MKVTTLTKKGDMELANMYVLGEEGEPAVIIDLSYNDNRRVEEYCAKHHSGIAGIFLTHGHYDHIAGLNDLSKGFDAPVIIHMDDEECLHDPYLNVSNGLFGREFKLSRELAIYRCEDEDEIRVGAHRIKNEAGEEITVGGYEFHVIHTPYHTAGSCCFYLPEHKILFSGDSLFHLGVGRSDLPGSKPRLFASSMKKLMALPEDVTVYPGHGPKTTIGTELRYNEYLKNLR